MLPLWLAQTQVQTTQKGQQLGRMLYNELEQGDILSGVRFGVALLAYTDILLCSICAIHRIRQSPAELLKQWVEHWKPLAYRGMEGVVELFGQAPRPLEPQAVSAKVRAAHHAFLARCGLNAVEA